VTSGLSLALAAPTAAQTREPVALVEAITIAAADLDALPFVPQSAQIPRKQPALTPVPAARPGALVPLYGSFGLLQLMDAHSTLSAVRAGAVERNPVMAPLASNPGGMLAVKAATTAGTIVLAEKLWRRHPAKAVTLMVAVNAAYAAIVAANYRK
jgi:hypothetical protein